jgi:hypothetical protein
VHGERGGVVVEERAERVSSREAERLERLGRRRSRDDGLLACERRCWCDDDEMEWRAVAC